MIGIEDLLTRGVENIYPDKASLGALLASRKIRLYHGIDPTGGSLHLGHMAQLLKLKGFQELGHSVIILIGDFTAQIGDPTDKTATRKRLSHKEVLNNAKDYKKQIGKILDLRKTIIKHNSEWLGKLKFADVVELAANFTAQQMLARDMFKKRIAEGKDLYLHEFLYPLMQAYDSIVMDVDLEIGGNDQMFNMLAGRTLMKKMKDKEKFVLTTRLLVDPTGKKMGKTEGNMVNLSDSADQMFGKIMSWPDEIILTAFEILTQLPMERIKGYESALESGENPRNIKFILAQEIIRNIYEEKVVIAAGEEFNKIFRDKENPESIENYQVVSASILDIVHGSGLVTSKSEAKRLIDQGGVTLDGNKMSDPQEIINPTGQILKVGKRKFIKLVK